MSHALRAAATPPVGGRGAGAHNPLHAGEPVRRMKPAAGQAPLTACVLLLRPQSATSLTEAQRSELRLRLPALANTALRDWPAAQRVVLQAGEGLAVVGELAPSQVLAAARRVAQAIGKLSMSIVLHRGPVTPLRDASGAARVSGPALDRLAELAGLQEQSGVLASQDFIEALARQDPGAAREFRPLTGDRPGQEGLLVLDPALGRRRTTRRALLGSGGLVALLAAGYAGRIARERYEEAHRPAVVLLDIKPSGEVFVDGQSQGLSPPLARLSLPPGPHTIEVRSGRARPMRLEVLLKPGQQMELRHVFAAPPSPRRAPATPRQKPGAFDRFKFW